MESVLTAQKLESTRQQKKKQVTLESLLALEADLLSELDRHTKASQAKMRALTLSIGSGPIKEALKEVGGPVRASFAGLGEELRQTSSLLCQSGAEVVKRESYLCNLAQNSTLRLQESRGEARGILEVVMEAQPEASLYRVV